MKNPFSSGITVNGKLIVYRSTKALSTELDGETAILHMVTNAQTRLDQIGTTIWYLLEKPISLTELVTALTSRYEVSEAHCHKDLCAFLADLYENRLIEIRRDTT